MWVDKRRRKEESLFKSVYKECIPGEKIDVRRGESLGTEKLGEITVGHVSKAGCVCMG